MGGIIIPNTKISGAAGNPGIPLIDSPTGGLYETSDSGVGISLGGNAFLEINEGNFFIGQKPSNIPFTMQQIAASPFVNSGYRGMAVSPDGAFVFGTNFAENTVSVSTINAISGDLSPVPGSPFGTDVSPKLALVSPDGAHALVLNGGGTISVHAINALTGFLTQVAGSPFLVDGINGVAFFSITPDGGHVIVSTGAGNTVHVFALNASTGFLTQVAGSPFAVPGNVTGLAISPDGAYVFAQSFNNNNLYVFSRNALTGFLTPVFGSPFLTGTNPGMIVVSPDGAHVLNGNVGDSTINVFSLNAQTGFLKEVAGSPFAVPEIGTNNQDNIMAFSPDGAYLFIPYVTNIAVYTFNEKTGNLAVFAGSPYFVAAVGVVFTVVVSPDGRYVIAGCNGRVAVFVTSSIAEFRLLLGYFDPDGGDGGILYVNGRLQMLGSSVLSEQLADARYAALAGLITQAFSAKSLTLDHAAGGLEGTPTNDNAVAGMVGEYISASVATPGGALGTGVVSNVTSIVLTAGDWDVDGVVDFLPGALASITQLLFGISEVSVTLGAQDTYGQLSSAAQVPGANLTAQRTPTVRISLAAPATIYLVAEGVFTVDTLNAFGTIQARRRR